MMSQVVNKYGYVVRLRRHVRRNEVFRGPDNILHYLDETDSHEYRNIDCHVL